MIMYDQGKAMVPSGQNQIRLLHPVRIRGATSVVSTAPLPRMKRSGPQSADESTVLLFLLFHKVEFKKARC